MISLTDHRAAPLLFAVDGKEYEIASPTVRQWCNAVALDPQGKLETPEQRADRMMKQADILTENALWLADLDLQQLAQVVYAISAHVHGYDAANAVQMQSWLKKKALDSLDAMLSPNSPGSPTISPITSGSPSQP